MPVIKVFASDGTTLLGQAAATEAGQTARLNWQAPADGIILIDINSANAQVAGTNVTYKLFITKGFSVYLPQVTNQ
jgi:hypothetical protein